MKDKQNKEEQLGCNTTVYEIHVKSGLHVAQPQCFEQMGLHVHTLYSLVSLFQPPPPSQLLLSRGVLLPFVAYTVLVGGHSAGTGMFCCSCSCCCFFGGGGGRWLSLPYTGAG